MDTRFFVISSFFVMYGAGCKPALLFYANLVIILLKIIVRELYMERMGTGDYLYGAKSRILRFVDGWNDCQRLLIGLAAIIPTAKAAMLGKSFG